MDQVSGLILSKPQIEDIGPTPVDLEMCMMAGPQ